MSLSQNVVCFLDILGFKQMVMTDKGPDEPQFLPLIEEVFHSIQGTLNDSGMEIRQFSDSIILASRYYTITNTLRLIKAVADVQYAMVSKGILVRGGISLGKHYSNGNIVYSEGLVHAYNLESTKAKFPRVLVDHELINLIIGTAKEDQIDQLLSDIARNLLIDKDHLVFVNYLNESDITLHEEAIRKLLKLANLSEPGLFEKYRWLTEYHNYILEKKGESKIDFELPQIMEWSKDTFTQITPNPIMKQ